ncbi:MAG: hypothetical protein E6Q57_14740 [Mycobacterium sp.]|nr:MAG: hypothetical protein E6Q57_14740 [Mycobacterium sp.]
MVPTSPARIDDDLCASAKLAGEARSRSASQQVAHWARIGREVEASSGISQRDLAEVLAGARTCDSLNPKEQAVVRAEWTERMMSRREALDLAARFAAAGRSWIELDEDGKVVERSPVESSPTARASQNALKAKATKSTKAASGAATRKVAPGVASARAVVKPTDARASKPGRKPKRRASGARSTP